MNPLILFILAILSPVIMAASIIAPPYAGIVGASYIIYDKGAKIHPLQDKLYDFFYMIDVYTGLFKQWSNHMMATDLISYTLPLLGLPIAGIMLALWLTGKIARKLKDIFQMGASF